MRLRGSRADVAKTFVYATVEAQSAIDLETAKCVAELVAESTSHALALLTSFTTGCSESKNALWLRQYDQPSLSPSFNST